MFSANKAIGVMKPGHCFTIEPMINEGNWRDELWPDKWTAVTVDGLRSAQFEHTMIVVKRGEGYPVTSAMLEEGPPLDVVTARHIRGEDRLAGLDLPHEDALHFRRYGRPHFVDQLYDLKMDVNAILGKQEQPTPQRAANHKWHMLANWPPPHTRSSISIVRWLKGIVYDG